MALLHSNQVWVGAERRADGYDRTGYPGGYVTFTTDGGERVNLTPEAARYTAKALKAFADVVKPPTARKRRA